MHKYSPQSDIVMTRNQVRGFDSWAINTALVPGVVLMENAGRSCAELIKQKLAEIDNLNFNLKRNASLFLSARFSGLEFFAFSYLNR